MAGLRYQPQLHPGRQRQRQLRHRLLVAEQAVGEHLTLAHPEGGDAGLVGLSHDGAAPQGHVDVLHPQQRPQLVALAQHLDGRIVTNDYNLNKIARLRGVEVININDLANALKPIVLPGEVMKVQILKEGKEAGQGVAYLEDGTMVVVDHSFGQTTL